MEDNSLKGKTPESVASEPMSSGRADPIAGISNQSTSEVGLMYQLLETERSLRDQEEGVKEEKRKKAIYRNSLIVAIIIIIILLLRGCSGKADYWWVPNETAPQKESALIPEIEDSALVQQVQETQEEYETPHIDIPVIQSFVVSKSAPYKDLYNPETNAERYYLQYEFTVVGSSEPFYQSKFVEGGKQFSVDFGSLLEIGEYRVNVATKTYEYGTLAPKSGDMHEIQIIVTE